MQQFNYIYFSNFTKMYEMVYQGKSWYTTDISQFKTSCEIPYTYGYILLNLSNIKLLTTKENQYNDSINHINNLDVEVAFNDTTKLLIQNVPFYMIRQLKLDIIHHQC